MFFDNKHDEKLGTIWRDVAAVIQNVMLTVFNSV